MLACRNAEKAEAARAEILEGFPEAKVDVIPLDLMDFSSVRAFAARFKDAYFKFLQPTTASAIEGRE